MATTTATSISTTPSANTLKTRPPTFLDTPIFDTIAEPTTLRTFVENDIYLLGGQYAILCQFAQPALAKGSFKHSDFASRIYQRLRNTSRFINAAVFGTHEEKAAIFSVIHKYHARVKGADYDANDPELHRWTAATLFVAIVVVHEAFFGKMSHGEIEALYRESAVFGTSLRMPPEMWPESLDAFWRYWNYNLETLVVTDEARKLCGDLLYPTTGLPVWMRMVAPFARIATVNWLPERLAREYGLQPSLLARGMYWNMVLSTRVLYPWLPRGVTQRQHRMYMEDLQRAVVRVKETGHWAGF
ncbi:hypothetical protein FE257_010841 [Aspergillus nanangensis]|uniref:ER-bound oxygenase mpaB/mpaB'/Rubber oxygenase catalytic domain-containing protein n=1 Tax=Aspergillus nanangensis TaxID=2582783 RepID=A0AAD4CVL3_ASPNN|nr:hypothetical protein FE257_010841 [Aspergillus nanangensis]